MAEVRHYSYKPRPGTMLLCTLFFVVCGGILGYMSYTNDRGMIINHLIELSTLEATIFLGILAFLSSLIVLVGLMAAYTGLTTDAVIELSDAELKVPKFHIASKPTVRIQTLPLQDIQRVTTQDTHGQMIVTFYMADGKSGISRSYFESRTDYENFMNDFEKRLAAARSAAGAAAP